MRRTFAISPFFALAVLLATSTAPAAEARPNFVVILADDQAWNGTAPTLNSNPTVSIARPR